MAKETHAVKTSATDRHLDIDEEIAGDIIVRLRRVEGQ